MLSKVIAWALFAILATPAISWSDSQWQDKLYDSYGLEVNGFLEAIVGVRVKDDPLEKDLSIAETRLQLDINKAMDWGVLKLKGDLLADPVVDEYEPSLREANVSFSPLDFMDLKIGRQILTWGTGDLIFINDMFPKDWQSFFIGRNDEYLKAPSDAVKISLFYDKLTFDFVYNPIFNGSKYVTGERLSFFNPLTGGFTGRDSELLDEERSSIDDAEFNVRLSTNLQGTELALYGYSGFWQSPEGFSLAVGRAYYPTLSVYGASARTTMLGGVANIEVGYYDSRANRDGNDPTNRNSEARLLAGFERELGHDFTGAVQYYLEWMQDYDSYEQALIAMAPSMPRRDEYRHMLTLRLTKLAMQQNLTISFFTYYSPSDRDGYLRPKVNYRLSDDWQVEAGANLFWGEEDYTFWGRFQNNNNIFSSVRYSY